MRLFVYGNNTVDKGHQLETLMASVLKKQGYSVVKNERGNGGHEVDVTATKEDSFGESTLICECKAHKAPIETTDWLKFVGKVYLAHRKDSRAHGIMVALSGANGAVIGNYKEIKSDNFITLITNDEIYNLVAKVHPLLPVSEVVRAIKQYTSKDVVSVDIIYYESLFYWLICFPSGQYTILKDDLSSVDGELLDEFKKKAETETNSSQFLNITEEYEAYHRKSFIRSLILSYTLDHKQSVIDTVDWINSIKPELKVTGKEVSDGVDNIPFLFKSESGEISVVDTNEIDFIEFYRFILNGTVSTRVMSTKFYKDNINEALLEKIKEVQCGIQIPEESVEDCLFLFKHSPSALAYAINPDVAITRYRGAGMAATYYGTKVDKGHTEWFLDNVMNGFIADYNTQGLHDYYLDEEKIASIEIHTKLKIFKDGEEPREMSHFKAECLGRLGEEFNNKVILMVKLPED